MEIPIHKPHIELDTSHKFNLYCNGYNAGLAGKLIPYDLVQKEDRLYVEIGFEAARDYKHGTNTVNKRWPQ